MEEEIWKDIPDYEGHYQCSSVGRIKSLERRVFNSDGKFLRTANERILRPSNYNGYRLVVLYNGKLKKTIQVHQIVAICFLSHIPNKHVMVIDHIDGDRNNNKLSNLRIVTNRENSTTCFRSLSSKFTSSFVGVSWAKNASKWTAKIQIGSKYAYLGLFNTEQDASNAYQLALSNL